MQKEKEGENVMEEKTEELTDVNVRNTLILIERKQELTKYNLDKKWNDYIAVQKEILRVLREDGFFIRNIVCNAETGIQIRISPKDIRETFGKDKRFQSLPRELKEYKVVTISRIKELIEEARLYEDNVENIHRNQTDTFAYFRNRVVIDGKEVIVRISVKKKVGSNHFHIHHIDTNEKSPELLGPSQRTEVFEIQDSNNKLADN